MSLVELSILAPGFVAGLLVLATHVPMGREVLRRGIIFIDLAVAQTAGLGVIGAGALGWDPHGVAAQVAAFLAAIAAGVFLTWTERHWGEVQEAIIGALFVMTATGGILLLANHPKAGDELRDLLVGQILWVDMHVIWPALVVTAVVLLCWYRFRERLGPMGFYLLFAVSVTVAVQLVGVYLVFASLIIPALATRSMDRVPGLAAAYGIGVSGYALGLLGSAWLDLPTGAVVVWTLAVVAVLWRFLLRRA